MFSLAPLLPFVKVLADPIWVPLKDGNATYASSTPSSSSTPLNSTTHNTNITQSVIKLLTAWASHILLTGWEQLQSSSRWHFPLHLYSRYTIHISIPPGDSLFRWRQEGWRWEREARKGTLKRMLSFWGVFRREGRKGWNGMVDLCLVWMRWGVVAVYRWGRNKVWAHEDGTNLELIKKNFFF